MYYISRAYLFCNWESVPFDLPSALHSSQAPTIFHIIICLCNIFQILTLGVSWISNSGKSGYGHLCIEGPELTPGLWEGVADGDQSLLLVYTCIFLLHAKGKYCHPEWNFTEIVMSLYRDSWKLTGRNVKKGPFRQRTMWGKIWKPER